MPTRCGRRFTGCASLCLSGGSRCRQLRRSLIQVVAHHAACCADIDCLISSSAFLNLFGEGTREQLLALCREARRLGCDFRDIALAEMTSIDAPTAERFLNRLSHGPPKDIVDGITDTVVMYKDMYLNQSTLNALEATAMSEASLRIATLIQSLDARIPGGGFNIETEDVEVWKNVQGLRSTIDEAALASIGSVSKSCNKQHIVNQVSIISHTLQLLEPLSFFVIEMVLSSATKEEKRISVERQKVFSSLRHGYKNMTMAIQSMDLATTLSDAAGGLGLVFRADFVQSLIAMSGEVIDAIGKMWIDDATKLIECINAWVPNGWQAVKDNIVEHSDVQKALMTNTHYKGLGAASGMLESMRKCLKSINSDGHGPIADALIMKGAGDAVGLATETVFFTWALNQIVNVIPKKTEASTKKEAVDFVASESKRLAIPLGLSLTVLLNAF
jgi:hypothetical protein